MKKIKHLSASTNGGATETEPLAEQGNHPRRQRTPATEDLRESRVIGDEITRERTERIRGVVLTAAGEFGLELLSEMHCRHYVGGDNAVEMAERESGQTPGGASMEAGESRIAMSLVAITRDVSSSINDCELSFHGRQAIDVAKAITQHEAYRECLKELGVRAVSLPAEPGLPDAVFVEDTAVVLDELAVIAHMGAASRRPEVAGVAEALARYRSLEFMKAPATLDGGDVMRVGRTLFVGLSRRTNRQGVEHLRQLVGPPGYEVRAVETTGCLHLKSACRYMGKNTALMNRAWIDAEALRGFEMLDVPAEEPNAANALLINDVVILPECFPKTRALLASSEVFESGRSTHPSCKRPRGA